MDFPDKFYHGSFDRDATVNVRADDGGVHIDLDRSGEDRRHVGFHIHYYLLSEIIESLAAALSDGAEMTDGQRKAVRAAIAELQKAMVVSDSAARNKPKAGKTGPSA